MFIETTITSIRALYHETWVYLENYFYQMQKTNKTNYGTIFQSGDQLYPPLPSPCV